MSAPEPYTQPEHDTRKRVLLMGSTGTGKSTLISNIVGRDIGIGHELRSCTKSINEFEATFGNEIVFLVDTPGFDDSDVPDVVILKRISDWLKKKNVQGSAIVGVIYLHKISDARMSGSAKRNLNTFQALCGEDYSPRIVIVTTHWTGARDKRRQNEEERVVHFEETFWKNLINKGARRDKLEYISSNVPFLGNTIDPTKAQGIFHMVLDSRTKGTGDLQFREEVVKQKKRVIKTKAGNVVDDSITERLDTLKEERQGLMKTDDDTAEQLQEIKEETRLLKLNRAKLRGSLFGQLRYGL